MKILFALALLLMFTNSGQASEQWVEVKNARLFCRTIGSGKPLIVLHGGPGLSQDYLLPQLYQLAAHNFVIFYDQRGCGQSTGDINLETITIDSFVDDLDAIRKAFGFETVSLLGHSWGGLLAMEYASAHPECVEKLILSNSTPSSSDGCALFGDRWLLRTAPYQEEMTALHNQPGFEEGDPELMERYHRALFRGYCHRPEDADLLNLRMSSTAILNGTQVFDCMRQVVFERPYNLAESLSTLSIPTLVIHGDDDIMPVVTAQATHACINGSVFILIQNCGHFPYVEQPDLYFTHVRNFLNYSSYAR